MIITFMLIMATAVFLMKSAAACKNQHDLILKKFIYDNTERSFYLHLPSNYEGSKKLPLILVLHGGGNRGDGKTPAKWLNFNLLADSNNFIVVYPNGIGGIWNDGRGVTYNGASDTTINDVGFIAELINHLVETYNADAKKVYVTGLSNGGMMTLRLGCELSSKITAIAPVIANFPQNTFGKCRPDTALPVLIINGTEDPLVPWKGGYVKFFRRKMGKVVSTKKTVQFWVSHNKCNETPIVENLPDKDKQDNSTVTVYTYDNDKNGCKVVLYSVNGGGHTLPGSNMPDRPYIFGIKNNDINGPKVIWEFFNEHSKK